MDFESLNGLAGLLKDNGWVTALIVFGLFFGYKFINLFYTYLNKKYGVDNESK